MNPTDAILERIEALLQQLLLIMSGGPLPEDLPSVPDPPTGKKPNPPGKS